MEKQQDARSIAAELAELVVFLDGKNTAYYESYQTFGSGGWRDTSNPVKKTDMAILAGYLEGIAHGGIRVAQPEMRKIISEIAEKQKNLMISWRQDSHTPAMLTAIYERNREARSNANQVMADDLWAEIARKAAASGLLAEGQTFVERSTKRTAELA